MTESNQKTLSKAELTERFHSLPDEAFLDVFRLSAFKELPNTLQTKMQEGICCERLRPYFPNAGSIKKVISLAMGIIYPEDADSRDIDALKLMASKLGRTPLMIELPEDLALRLCRICAFRGWKYILSQAELVPLNGEEKENAAMLYVLKHASPDLLDKNSKAKLTEDEMQHLRQICDDARRLGRAPAKGEIPTDIFRSLNKKFGSFRDLLDKMGIPKLEKKFERKISRPRYIKRQAKQSKERAGQA